MKLKEYIKKEELKIKKYREIEEKYSRLKLKIDMTTVFKSKQINKIADKIRFYYSDIDDDTFVVKIFKTMDDDIEIYTDPPRFIIGERHYAGNFSFIVGHSNWWIPLEKNKINKELINRIAKRFRSIGDINIYNDYLEYLKETNK